MKRNCLKTVAKAVLLAATASLVFSCASAGKEKNPTSIVETTLDTPPSDMPGAAVPTGHSNAAADWAAMESQTESKEDKETKPAKTKKASKATKETSEVSESEAAEIAALTEAEVTEEVKETAKKTKPVKEKKPKETKEEKKARKEREKLLKKQKQDQYTGWIYIPEKNFTITNDDVRIVMRGSSGSFGLYAINEEGKQIPLLVNYDSFNSTFLSVKIGRKVYRLNRENGVQCEARRTPYGAQMAYTIPKAAQIVIDFSFLPSIATSSRVDMVRVTIYTINLGKNTQSFTSKAVFDTLLGENAFTHFSTAARSRVDTESQFTNMNEEKWIRSSNSRATIQFLLNGKGITTPQYVTLSSKDSLSNTNWIPQVQDTKSFNSVLAYNNSAVGINWKTAYLDPLKSDIITFYISVATDGNEPAGKNFLASLAAGKTALSAKLPDAITTTTVAPVPAQVPESALATAYHENMPVIPGAKDGFDTSPMSGKGATAMGKATFSENNFDSLPVVPSPQKDSDSETKLPPPLPSSKTNANAEDDGIVVVHKEPAKEAENPLLTDPTLDPEYIQALLDKIASLSNDGSVSSEEIDRLNRELDEILAKLEQLP